MRKSVVFIHADTMIQELQAVLTQYANSKEIVWLMMANNQQHLVRIHEVGHYFFHAESIDFKTKLPIGFLHLPLPTILGIKCLEEDNVRAKLEKALQP